VQPVFLSFYRIPGLVELWRRSHIVCLSATHAESFAFIEVLPLGCAGFLRVVLSALCGPVENRSAILKVPEGRKNSIRTIISAIVRCSILS